MITLMRRKMKSRAAKNIFLWLVILALGLGFIVIPRLAQQRAGKEGWIATVNGQSILYQDFLLRSRTNDTIVRTYRSRFGDIADKLLEYMGLTKDPKELALDQLIQQKLLDEEAKKLAIAIGADFVSDKILDTGFIQREFPFLLFSGAITQQGVDPVALRGELRRWGWTIQDFEAAAINAMKRDMVLKIVEGSAYVSEFEVRQRYILNYLARKFSILTLDFDSFLKEAKKEQISKEELQKFYRTENATKKRYWVPEKRSGVAYIFDPKSYGITVSEDEVKNYYQDNKLKKFVEKPAEVQVRRILFKVAPGQDEQAILEKAKKIHLDLALDPSKFEDVAKKMSEDKESAKKGGLIPFFARGTRNKEFEKGAFLLQEDGEVSRVVRTDEGFEILQRVARKAPEVKSLKDVEAEIRKDLETRKFKRLFARDMNEIIGKRSFDQKRFDELIKKSIKKENIGLQVAKKDNKRLGALFRARDKMPATYIEDNKGVVVQISDVKKRHLPVLTDIEETVKDDIHERNACEKLNAFLQKIKEEAKTKSLKEIQAAYNKRYKISLDETMWTRKNDTQKVKVLTSKGYPVDEMIKIEKTGGVQYYRGSPQETAEGYLIKVNEIEKFNDKEYAEKKDDLKNELLKEKNNISKEDFIAFLRKKATIKINKDFKI